MFVDEVILQVEGGTGGDGCIAFRREKYVPMGGPAGGNGGHGGNIIFEADEGLKTLVDLRYQKNIKGHDGENGSGKNQTGKNGEDIIIKVPVGTIVTDTSTNLIIADLVKHGEKAIIVSGGRGGRGNAALLLMLIRHQIMVKRVNLVK
jgi:GTP-binding protein